MCKQTLAIGTNQSEVEKGGERKGGEKRGRGRWKQSGRKARSEKTSSTMCLSQHRQEKPQ